MFQRTLFSVVAFFISLSFCQIAISGKIASSGTVEDDVRALLTSVERDVDPVVALAKLQWLERMRPYMPVEAFSEWVLEAGARAADPRVRFELYRSGTRATLNRLDARFGTDGMQGPLGTQGCLTNWTIVGPFENASMQNFERELAPELGTYGPYEGRNVAIDWRVLPSEMSHLCAFYLNNVLHPSTASVAYLSTRLTSARNQRAVVLMGSQSAYKIWVNGKLVGQRREEHGLSIDNDAWSVEFKRGANDIVIKLGSTGQGGLSFITRVVDTALQPLANVQSIAHWEPQVLSARDVSKLHPSGVLHATKSLIETSESSARERIWAAWLWKHRQARDTATPWRDVAQAVLDNDAQDTLDAISWVVLSELFEESWKRKSLLEHVATQFPTHPWLGWSIARLFNTGLSRMEVFEQRDYLERLAEANPSHLAVQLEWNDWFARNDMAPIALQHLETLVLGTHEDVPAFVRRLINLHERAGNTEQADILRERMTRLSALGGIYTWQKAEKLASQQRIDEAVAWIDQHRQFTPWALQWGVRKAALLRTANRIEEAIALLDEVIALAPGQAQYYETKANYLIALGNTIEASSALEHASRLRPQEQRYHQLLSYLRPDSQRFFEPWMLENIRELAHDTEAGPYNYDTIIDQTVVRVAPNGLAHHAAQRVERVLRADGIDAARTHTIAYRIGDEQVEVLRVRVYKANGTIAEDYQQWRSGTSRKRSTTYNDTAYLNVRANNVEVGDLVEFRYIVSQVANENFRGDYFGDISYLQSTRPIAFQRYLVIYPESWELYFRAPTLPHERVDDSLPRVDGQPGEQVTAFTLVDVPRVHTEERQPGVADVYDYILVSNKETYDEIGHWWWNLVEEQLVVDDEMRRTVRMLTENLQTDEEKVRAIYNYVARNTRYLHVGLGIHGWKPYRTTTILRNRFGDCKDKTALLKVMLETAGIPTKLVLVRTRRLGVVDSYPASMHIFNHAIAHVPSLDLYLDATAEFNGSHELTDMNHGAIGVIIADGGKSRWLHLPIDAAEKHKIQYEMTVDLTNDAPITRGRITAQGVNAVRYRQSLQDAERRDELFERQLAAVFSGARLVSAKYADLDSLDLPTTIEFSFEAGGVVRNSKDRVFIYPVGAPLNLLDRLAKSATRRQPLEFNVPFTYSASLRYLLDDNRTFERIPGDFSMKTPFGNAQITYARRDNALEVDVQYSIAVQRVEIEEYPTFRQFVTALDAALNDTITIIQIQ